jgi:hypothetical protein
MSSRAKPTQTESSEENSDDEGTSSQEIKIPVYSLFQLVWVKVKGHTIWPGTVSFNLFTRTDP